MSRSSKALERKLEEMAVLKAYHARNDELAELRRAARKIKASTGVRTAAKYGLAGIIGAFAHKFLTK